MSETQALLGKISALRQRLEQAKSLASEARAAAVLLADDPAGVPLPLQVLAGRVAAAHDHDEAVDRTVRTLTAPAAEQSRPLPRQLTARARRALERGRELLGRLRALADTFALSPSAPGEGRERGDPLVQHYRETAAVVDTTLRLVLQLPDSASAQLHLCEGLEALLNVVAERLRLLTAALERERHETGRIDRLARLLIEVESGRCTDLQPFLILAAEVQEEVREVMPFRFLEGDPRQPAHFVACHALTVAQVIARVSRHEPELRGRQLECILAALLHDVGMLRVTPALLTHAGPLDDEGKRLIEGHTRDGGSLVAPLLPDGAWLVDAVTSHHERLDGTGYPDGLRQHQIKPLTRLLAVCDVYTAFAAARPQRPARETRTALADTLLLAEQGQLDRQHAECLLHLSFYPLGSAVELADGSVGVVVATADPRHDLNSPARPVVAVLLDPQGQPQALPHHLDLARCDDHSIVRTLASAERRAVLGPRFPQWA